MNAEYLYNYGDPRPVLLQHLLETCDQMGTVLDLKAKKTPALMSLPTRKCILLECNQELKKVVVFPEGLAESIKNCAKPLVLIPMMIQSKSKCKTKDSLKHLNLLLFNKLTHELQRIDIRGYHLDGYRIKLIVKKLKEDIRKYFRLNIDPETTVTRELDISNEFASLFQPQKVRDAFPKYIITYMHMRNRNPQWTSKEARIRIPFITPDDVNAPEITVEEMEHLWKHFNHTLKAIGARDACDHPDTQVKNHASGRCVNVHSSTYKKMIIDYPQKPCKQGKVFNHVSHRCILPQNLQKVNILLEEAMAQEYRGVGMLKHVDRKNVAVQAINFIISKFPFARVIMSDDIASKEDFKIIWRRNHETGERMLKFPKGFWSKWEQAMHDNKIRFVIAFVGLFDKSDGAHANLLIYDKHKNEMERFDGLGRDTNQDYELDMMDQKLTETMLHHLKHVFMGGRFGYFTPMDYCPRMAIFQSKEIDDIPGVDKRGNCAVWRLWYMHIRLSNPNIDRKTLVKYAVSETKNVGNLHRFIKSYQLYILNNINQQHA